MNWSPQQQHMLAAMGYVLYTLAGAPAAVATVQEAATASHVPPSRLLQALVRAAGGRDPSSLPLPPMEQLRSSAAAKRALWPALRALRRPA